MLPVLVLPVSLVTWVGEVSKLLCQVNYCMWLDHLQEDYQTKILDMTALSFTCWGYVICFLKQS